MLAARRAPSPGALSVRRSLETKSAPSPGLLTMSTRKAHRVNAQATAGSSAPGEAIATLTFSDRRSKPDAKSVNL
jgi:hypothetical protein